MEQHPGAAAPLPGVVVCEIIYGCLRRFEALASLELHWHQVNMTEPLQIIATDVLYYHEADERAFFEWLDRMACVADYHGELRDLFINLNRFPTDDDMWEIIGFCRRYGVKMAQLAKFETPENTAWLRDDTMIWHREIFGGLSERNGN